ncbi:hypothetical protein [Streptomyces sp. NPDC059452]|uniref:hypothetical protein n=1 Tax=Streptomyces sp. NPDC059452 TaxID=3346835 RepID=UPI0036C4A3E4
MSLFRKPQPVDVIVLRDAPDAVTSLRHALKTATDAERPGLERALALVEEAAERPDGELRGRWVRRHLDAAGYAGPADSLEAIKALRQAEPALSLRQAVTYAKEAAAAEQASAGQA